MATGALKLEWKDGPLAPFPTEGRSVAVSGDMLYCVDGVSDTNVQLKDRAMDSSSRMSQTVVFRKGRADSNWRETSRQCCENSYQSPTEGIGHLPTKVD